MVDATFNNISVMS